MMILIFANNTWGRAGPKTLIEAGKKAASLLSRYSCRASQARRRQKIVPCYNAGGSFVVVWLDLATGEM
jgi:hypothetical protein